MNYRMISLLAVTSLLGAEGAFAAKCYFRSDTNDFFSGVQTWRTEWGALNSESCEGDCNARASMSLVEESGNKRIELKVGFSIPSVFRPTQDQLGSAFIAPAGTRLQVTLKDGSTVEIPTTSGVEGSTHIQFPYEDGNDKYITHISAQFTFGLNEADANALSAQTASTVRILGANQELIVPVGKRERSDFMEPINCLREGKEK